MAHILSFGFERPYRGTGSAAAESQRPCEPEWVADGAEWLQWRHTAERFSAEPHLAGSLLLMISNRSSSSNNM
jgi:hypothetical protein